MYNDYYNRFGFIINFAGGGLAVTDNKFSIYNIEKLDDDLLELVSGGLEISDKASTFFETSTMYIGPLAAIGAFGCTVAGLVYHSKASQARAKGNTDKEEKYNKTFKKLGASAIACTGFLAANSIALGICYHMSE